MRPLSLRIEGLRSFRKQVEIDFGDRDQIAVVGDTGAGKSSILEAMTYALYGKTSFAGQNQDLMNDTSDKMRVVLRFQVSDQEWEVVRTLRRDGKGQVKPSGARLRLLGKDGEPLEVVDQVRPVNERVERMIGLDSDAFLRTVVLPQGRFARLLVEDRPADRSKVLRRLWPTRDLEAVGELASEALRDLVEIRAQLGQEATVHPEDPEAHLARLSEAAATARQKADEASGLANEASQAFRSLEAARKDRKQASAEIDRVEPGLSRIEEAEAQIAPVAERLREIDKADEKWKRKRASLRDELARIPSEDGPDQTEVATALAALNSFGDLGAEAVEAAGEMRRKATAAEGTRKAAGQAKEAAKKSTQKAERHAQRRRPLAEACEAARARREDARLAHQRCDGLRNRATEAQTEVADLADRRAELAAKVENAADEAGKAKAAVDESEERLADARRANPAAAAAHGLHAGDDCPVCRRGLPVGWSPPEDAGHAEAEAVARNARRAAQQLDQKAASVDAELRSVDRQLNDARANAKQASAEYRSTAKEIAAEFVDGSPDLFAGTADDISNSDDPDAASNDAPAADAPLLPSMESLLRPLEAVHQEASDALARHDDEHKTLEKEQARLSNDAATAEAEANGADELAEAARRTAVDALARLARNVDETPSPYRPRADLPTDPAQLDKIDRSAASGPIAAAQERGRVLEHRERQRRRLNREMEEADEARESLARRRVDEVGRPLSDIAEKLGPHRDDVLQAVNTLALGDALGAVADLPGAPSATAPAVHQEWMRNLHRLALAVVKAARERVKEAAAAEQAARDALEELGRRLVAQRSEAEPVLDAGTGTVDSLPDELPTAPEDVVTKADSAREDADYAARTNARQRDDFAAIKDDVVALRALFDEAGDLERALGDLDKALKDGAFPKWLTLQRSRSLLIHASRMLGEISGGKYSFVDPENEEVQWQVLDDESGQPRSPASLSGGEQFIASLALALGMVEMMARSGGRLESLFLDEGFGSLDRSNLDAAVEALGTVAAKGRMVGVISHVRAVAEQVDHVLEVERTASGSRAKWLSRDQRQGISRSDAEWEASAAMEGLLD